MDCPNCGCFIESDKFCGSCGCQLIYFNNTPYIKVQYDEIAKVHQELDNFRDSANVSVRNIEKDLNNPNVYMDLNNNPDEMNNFLKTLNDSEKSLVNFKKRLNSTFEDNEKLNYIRSMNSLFGNVDNKINECYDLINKSLNYIEYFRNNINNMDNIISQIDSDYEDIKNFHSQIDEVNKNIISLDESLDDVLHNDEDLYQLKTDKSSRKEIQENLEDSKNFLIPYRKDLEKKLSNKKEMKKLHKLDSQCGNIEDKMRKCISIIDSILSKEDKITSLIESVEKTQTTKEIPLNKNRILDL